jgi:membrane protein
MTHGCTPSASSHGRATAVQRLAGLGRSLGRAALGTPGLGVLLLAVRNYVMHQSANQAGSLAFSSVLAAFPLVLLLSAAAGYVGQPGDAAALVARVMGYAPALVREAVQPVIDEVIAQRNQALLTIGLFATLWTASSGMQAVRTALNKAYGVAQGLPFWKARIKVTVFTVVVGACTLAAFSSVIIVPYLWRLLEANVGAGQESFWLRTSVRYGAAWLVLTTLYALLYGWLPDVRQRVWGCWWGGGRPAPPASGPCCPVPSSAQRCGSRRPPCCRTRWAAPASWPCCTAASPAWWPRWCSCTSAAPR